MLFGIDFLNFDILSAIIFLILMCIFLYIKRDNLVIQSGIKLGKIPILYFLLLKTKIGLKLMDKIAEKYREPVKLFGYIAIGVGFIGMLLVTFMMVFSVVLLFTRPDIENGAALLVPFTTIPGFGYLSFWHFIISIFCIATIHEFAHGVVARAHDITVKNSGTGAMGLIVPLIPLAFVEPDEEQMKKKSDIAQYSVFAAGPFINIIIGIFLYLLFIFAFVPMETNMIEQNGFSFDLINDSYPASIAGMTTSTIVTLNGDEITNFWDFHEKMNCVRPGESITIGTDKGDYSLITTTSPDNENKGFIGIKPIENKIALKEEYKPFSKQFFWIKGLFQWLYRLNLLVGFFNLLPILIVDGGRMFQIATGKIFPDKKKSDKIIKIIAMILGAIIVIMLAKTYLPKLINLLSYLIGF